MRLIGKIIGLLSLGVVLVTLAALAPIAPAAAHGGDPGGSSTYGPTARGEVTQVFFGNYGGNRGEECCIIAINGAPYNVPRAFWQSVEVGDIVNFDGVSWSIVRPSYATGSDSGT